MKPLCFTRNYSERRSLADGTDVVLRLVRPGDSALLVRGFERLSPESRYRRFLTYKKALSDDEILYFTHVDGMKHFAIGAVVERADGSEEGVGIARFVRLADNPLAAEAALTVVDDYQDKGLGQLLLERLFSAAAERGLRELHFIVLPSNGRALALLHKLQSGTKHAVVARFEGSTVKHVIAVPSVPGAFR